MGKSLNKQWLALYGDTWTVVVPVAKIEAIYEKMDGKRQAIVTVAGEEYQTCMTMEKVMEELGAFEGKKENYSMLLKPVEEVCGWDWPVMLREAEVDAEALDSLLYLDRTLETLKKGGLK